MSALEWAVTALGVALIVGVNAYFLAPRRGAKGGRGVARTGTPAE